MGNIPKTVRILGWTLGYWHYQNMANDRAQMFQDWHRQFIYAFKPFETFIASGSWSEPSACPIPSVVVNAGLPFDRPYYGQKHHYGIAAFTAAMAYACNRNDWDFLVTLDTEALIGDVNLPELFQQFSESNAILMSPGYFPYIGGPFMAWKRAGALRLLHNRQLSNLRDEDEPDREVIWEEECHRIYRGGRWWNPWPNIECMLGSHYQSDCLKPIRENWPFVGQHIAGTAEPYAAQCSTKLIPL